MTGSGRHDGRAAGWRGKLVLLCAAILPLVAEGQAGDGARAGVGRPATDASLHLPSSSTRIRLATARSEHSAALVTAASALLPGAGQGLMRQRRGILYFALEAVGVGFYVSRQRDGSRQRDRYREISRTVARAEFSPDGPQGVWDYYESMEKFVESGRYDVLAGGPVDPEMNSETFNGSVWLLARQTYWRDPESSPPTTTEEYMAALRFYTQRAVTEEFRWSWSGAPEAYGQYRSAIAGSNSAFRKAEQTASLILANHFLSAVDAYVSVHLRVRRNSDGSVSLSAVMPGAF